MYTAYITHSDCLLHDMGQDHPECPARLMAIQDQLMAADIYHYLQHHDAPLATPEQLKRAHTSDYVDSVFANAPTEGLHHIDDDTAMNPHTLNAALRAAGAVVMATDLVMQQQVANAFCAIRPPGHHAEAARGMGFSLFNNIAVGAAHAIAQHGLQRVAIVDFDVHHGNGTEDIFRNHPNVMLCSTFQHPFYPHSGVGEPAENLINVPLPAGTNGEAFRAAVETHWWPALHQFKPDMIFISSGFDAHREDDMAQFRLVEADYAWVTAGIKTIADHYAQGRIVSALEGGYALSALARCVVAHIKVLGAF